MYLILREDGLPLTDPELKLPEAPANTGWFREPQILVHPEYYGCDTSSLFFQFLPNAHITAGRVGWQYLGWKGGRIDRKTRGRQPDP